MKHMAPLIIEKLKSIKLLHLFWISLLTSELLTFPIVCFMSIVFKGRIVYDYLLTGAVCSLIVAAIIVSIILYFLNEIKKGEEELQKAHTHLERRVEERTLELSEINIQLKQEIKERLQAEIKLVDSYDKLKSTQAQLIQSAKLASIGELSSGIAHELNQPLTVIRGISQLFKRNLVKKNSEHVKFLEQFESLERNTRRMMKIINHLRNFSRQSQSDFSRVEINAVLDACLLMVGEQLQLRSIEVEKCMAPNLGAVHGDPNSLEQVFLNLLTNARDAIEEARHHLPEGSGPEPQKADKIRITTGNNDEGSTVIIQFIDTGNGIPSTVIEQIFDPFFTTKEVGKGTGLGLSVSYGIVKEHGGDIEVVETGADGTTFQVRLPVSNTDPT